MSVFAQYSTQNALESWNCPAEADRGFGPFSDCRFDFCLAFEQSVLSTLPAVIFLLLVPCRFNQLSCQDVKTVRNAAPVAKLVLSIAFVVTQVAWLVLFSVRRTARGGIVAIVSGAVNLLAAVAIVPLVQLEHNRSIRPSTVLSCFFLFSTLFDIAQARTLILYTNRHDAAGVLSCAMAVKLLCLVFESREKTYFHKPEYQGQPSEASAGILSRSFMWWLNQLLEQGSRGLLTLHHLDELDHDLQTEYLGERMQAAWRRTRSALSGKPVSRFAFFFTVTRCMFAPYSRVILPRLCLIGFTFAQPFLITRILQVLEEKDDHVSRQRGFGLVLATALTYVGIAISSLHSNHSLYRFIVMFRGATVSLIYRHGLSVDSGISNQLAAVSLMGADVNRISFCFEELNECWARLIEMAIGLPLLAIQLGWVSMVPLIVILLSSTLSSLVAKYIGGYQKVYSEATEKRITMTSSMLGDIKSLRMMGLSGVMTDIVQAERVKETKKRERFCWMIVWLNTVGNIPYVMSPAATFSVYALQAYLTGRDSLNVVQAFTSLALISLVSQPASRLLHAIPNIAAVAGNFDRIQEFLLSEKRRDTRILLDLSTRVPDVADLLNSIRPTTTDNSVVLKLRDVTLKPTEASNSVIRNVNIAVERGSLAMITGPVGSGKTVLLKAILGELRSYTGAISISTTHVAYCSQSPWLPNTTIRDAICGYTNLSIIDENWYFTVLKCCMLNDDISRFSHGDNTRIGSRAGKLSGGQKQRIALARAVYSRATIVVLDDVFSALDRKTGDQISERLFGHAGLLKHIGSTVVLVTHAKQYLSLADTIVVLDPSDKSLKQGTYDDFIRNGQTDALPSDQNDVEAEEAEKAINNDKVDTSELVAEMEAEDLQRRTGDIDVYRYYLKAVGIRPLLAFLLFVILYVFSGSFSQIWLKWWAEVDGRQIWLHITIYFLLAILYCVGNGGYAWAIVVVIGPSTGRKLHKVLLDTVMKAPLSFFVKTDAGSILNRFSQDMALIESQLATGVLITVSNLVSSLAEAAFVALGSVYMVLTIPFLMVAVYWLQRVYLKTSRQLRFLDLESRSPLYSHFTETIEGLSTIRAFGWEREMEDINNDRIDDSQKPYYLLFCIQRWLALVLDLIIAVMAVAVVALATSLRASTSPGLLGVSLNNVLSFSGSLSSFITGWTMLETSLGAIARLRHFEMTTEIEAKPGEDRHPPKDWPSQGLIRFSNASASYNETTVAFRNINMTVQPGQKLGICGRTGSGKTSLLSSILRTLDLDSGHITIDSLDLLTMPRETIRQRLITIPQDAFIISGSVRLNIDPFLQSSDSAMVSALERVNLWALISARGGLEADMQRDMLSRGEQQLFTLARAVLRKRTQPTANIVLLDEPTSSADVETHRLMQSVIAEEFHGCTVVTVAHREDTILNSDVVAVMEDGQLVEFGAPEKLILKHGGALRSLIGNLGTVAG